MSNVKLQKPLKSLSMMLFAFLLLSSFCYAEETDVSATIATDETQNAEESPANEIVPSRSVTLKVGEYLDVSYPGKDWVYLGSTDGTKKLSSVGRKVGKTTTNFTLKANTKGTAILHFYKEDVLAGNYIDDYLSVTIKTTRTKSSKHIKAPSYADAVPKKPAKKEESKEDSQTNAVAETTEQATTETTTVPKETKVASSQKTATAEKPDDSNNSVSIAKKDTPPVEKLPVAEIKSDDTALEESTIQNALSEDDSLSPTDTSQLAGTEQSADELLKLAKENIASKNYHEAHNYLELFLTVADKERDEALFLLGQIYESNSDSKDIKKAIATYEQLMENYIESSFWDEANKRSIYLKRFYINIR